MCNRITEQASSSQSSASTTATTSSATSMTSLEHDHEHDIQNTANTNSDGDWDCWDADNWGDMEQQPSATSGHGTSNISPSPHSPKANDQWTSLEEEPVRISSDSLPSIIAQDTVIVTTLNIW